MVSLENHPVDIMAINETWLREGEEARAPAPPGYRLRHTPRPAGVRSRGGGVGFYIRRGVYARTLDPPQTQSVEQMWLGVNLSGYKVAIGTAYRPPWLDVDTFIDALTESVGLFSTFDHIVLMGDFNINLLSINETKSKKLLAFLHCMKLEQYVNSATNFTDHSATLIDVMCSTAKINNVVVDHVPDLSSHAFILGELNIKKPKPVPRWISYRPFKDMNFLEFNAQVEETNWERVLCSNVNDSVRAFNSYIMHIFDVYAPVKWSFVKNQSYPWITHPIKIMMRERDLAYTKSRVTQLDTDRQNYKEMKTLVNHALYNEKRVFFQKNINRIYGNPKELWKNIKSHVVDFKEKQVNLPININDPNVINTHFLNVPGNNKITSSVLSDFETNRFSQAIFKLKSVDECTVSKIITDISTNALGVDGISRDMILLTLPRTIGVITAIINKSIQTGVFPDIWKDALVKPIPKINNPSELKDLRPISILPFMSKIVERVICHQLTEYLEASNILPQKQSGFRKGRGTATALLDVTDDILADMDVGRGAILVLLDFSRAFDTINHTLLLAKLAYYGFDSNALSWFSSYLCDRSQRVEASDSSGIKMCSEASAVTRGVPQGSILGPILFLIYTADITRSIKNCRFHLYADDLQLYLSFNHKDTISAVNQINLDLERISQWSDRNCLVLNPVKSKFMVMGTKSQIVKINSYSPIIKINGNDLVCVAEARNLGVLMDNRLRFHSHVMEVVRSCFYRLKVIYKVRQYLSEELRIYLCESLILSKLNYADTVIGECLLSHTKKLIQRVQNACARFCFTIPPRTHITPYLNKSNLMNMASRRSLHFACLLFGVMRTQRPAYLFEKLKFSSRQVRMATRLICPKYKTTAFRGSFRYTATKCWNNIPPPIRNSCTLWSFKKYYKIHLLSTQSVTS